MFGMLVIVGLVALAIASAIITDAKHLYREYKHIQAEFSKVEQNTMFDTWYQTGLKKAMDEFKTVND